MSRYRMLAFAAALLAPVRTAPAQHDAHGGALGTVSFPNSGNRAAQAPFLLGVALLHSFEYERAARAFREAERADSGLGLAYWGEALTYSHVLWREENLGAARGALQRFAPTRAARLARVSDPRERSFGAAVEAFFAEGSLPDRVRRYADAMRSHARSYPGDLEAAAFAAHAIMLDANTAPPAQRDSLTREAIDLAQRVARANPRHPGAVHYLIHLYDTPGMAAQGLAFARAYDRISPEAEHALHMPSHIYLQLGLWDDVVRSNARAWAASRAEGEPDWHAFSWLQYAYLQLGRVAEAGGLLDTARALTGTDSDYSDARYILARLAFQYAAETGQWEHPVPEPRVRGPGPASDRERGFELSARYWRAVDAAQRGDSALAALAAPFLALADSAERRSASRRSPVQVSNAFVVRGLVARSRGDRVGYRAAIQRGADLERQFDPFVGPPERVFALELLGEELEREGRTGDAASAYEAVLRLCPNRTRAVRGLARTRETPPSPRSEGITSLSFPLHQLLSLAG